MQRLILLATVAALTIALPSGGMPRRDPVRTPTPAKDYTFEQLWNPPPPTNERYYIIVFGSQSKPKLARFTHTWVSVVRVISNDGQAEPKICVDTISWMPATLRIHTLSRHTEPGVNLCLEESIRAMKAKGEQVAMWGPYELRHNVYRRFVIQKVFMDSGAVGYQCIDKSGEAGRTGDGCDCIHAITDVDPVYDRRRYPLRINGEDASLEIVQQLARRGSLVEGPKEQEWLRARLGFDCDGIVQRHYCGPVNDKVAPEHLPYYFGGAIPSEQQLPASNAPPK